MLHQHRILHLLLVAAAPICFAVDVLVCRLMWPMLDGSGILHQMSWESGFFLFTAGAGLLTGQSVLVAYWLTQGSGILSNRLPTSVALLMLLLFSWFLGGALTDNYPPYRVSLLITAFCLALFSIVATALWRTRLMTQRRIMAADTAHELQSGERFSLSYLLIMIAVIASFLAMAKTIFGVQSGYVIVSGPSFLGVSGKGLLVGLYVMLIVLPLAPMVLGKKRRKSKLAFTVAALTLFPLLTYEAYIAFQYTLRYLRYLRFFGRPSVEEYARVIGAAFAFGFAVFLVTTSGLWVARMFGYRLLSNNIGKEPDRATLDRS